MKITDVEIENFLTIGKARLRLGDRGLLLIEGDNRDDPSADSNGAGKSSIADAICWCLYGTTARDVTGDAVVNRTAKKGCVVEVRIVDGGDEYLVTRTRKPNILKVIKLTAAGSVDLSKGTEKETQEVINRIMGCSHEVFVASIYAGQEKMPDLPGMTDKQLKVLIEEAAGVEVLTTAYAHARQRLGDATAALVGAEGKLVGFKNIRGSAVDHFNSVTDSHVIFENTRKDRIEQAVRKVAHFKSKAEACVAELSKLNEPAIRASIKELQDGSGPKFEAEKKRELELEDLLRKGQGTHHARMAQVQVAKTAHTKAVADLDELRKKKAGSCKSCGRPFAEHDLADAENHAQEAINQAVRELTEAANLAKASQTHVQQLQEELTVYRKSMTDPTAVMKRQGELNLVIKQIDRLKAERDMHIQTAKEEIERTRTFGSEPNPYATLVNDAKDNLAKIEKDVADQEELVNQLKDGLELIEEAVKVFGPSGVRAHILDTVTPYLNEKTSEYLGALSDGAITAAWSTLTTNGKGELREKFNIEVSKVRGADSFAGLSGGEKRKVRLACAMALQDMVATRATKPIDLFIADEVDHALDESGLERLMGVLEKKARERGTVLVISHNSLSDWIDNVITVVNEGGVSRVEGAVNG